MENVKLAVLNQSGAIVSASQAFQDFFHDALGGAPKNIQDILNFEINNINHGRVDHFFSNISFKDDKKNFINFFIHTLKDDQDRILALAGREDALETKIGLLEQLGAFERSRSTRDPESGEPSDDARLRYKLSQAAWASRFEAEQGRRLRVEDELIRVDWERSRRLHLRATRPDRGPRNPPTRATTRAAPGRWPS